MGGAGLLRRCHELPAREASETVNLTIDGLHIQQVVQNYAGTVPMAMRGRFRPAGA